MNELQFKYWLKENNFSKKMQSDIISRLKKLEHELSLIDIDDEYTKNKCENMLLLFAQKGENKAMEEINPPSLPIGKYWLSTYKYALKTYIKYLDTLFETAKNFV